MRFISIAVIAVASRVILTRGSGIGAKAISATPDLIQAVSSGDIETVQYLIERKVNLNESDTTGSTALLRAIMSRHEAIADLLIRSGANVNQVNDEGSLLFESRVNMDYLISRNCSLTTVQMLITLMRADLVH